MSWWQILLFPFAIIYDLVTRSRNWLYDIGWKKINSYSKFSIISVGNLSVGGTGKTPFVEYLIRYGLENNWRIATLSRGYGRRTKGVRIANVADSAETLGDESYGYFEQFGEEISVVVAEKRVEGIERIKMELANINVILMDDAFQHRSVKPDVSFLLTTSERPFWSDFILPSGRLREARAGYKRADLVVITKSQHTIGIPVDGSSATSKVSYGEQIQIAGEKKPDVLAVAGIANPADFYGYVSSNFEMIASLSYDDHHAYQFKEIRAIVEKCLSQNAQLITTYKDAVKLQEFEEMNKISWGYIPIKVTFVSGEEKVLELLQSINKKC